MHKQTLIYTMFAICFALFLTSCGRGTTEERPTPQENVSVGTAATPQTGGRLRILAPAQFEPILNAASADINLTRGVEVSITTFNPETRANYWAERLPRAIEAGEFDIFFADPRQPLFEMAQDGMLADIFRLIDLCPQSDMRDFYFEALQTLAIDGSLYFFPLGFGFQYVGINTLWIPQEFVDRFNSYETITVNQMIQLYLDVQRNYTIIIDEDDFSTSIVEPRAGQISLALANCRDLLFPEFMVWNAIPDYIDLNSRTSNLAGDEFTQFLINMLELFPRLHDTEEMTAERKFRHNTIARSVVTRPEFGIERIFPAWIDDDPWWTSGNYVFAVHNEFLNPVLTLVPIRRQFNNPFLRFIPLVDETGRLRTNIGTTFPWKTVAVTDGANAELSWNFISQYLLPATTSPQVNENYVFVTPELVVRTNLGLYTFDSPIKKSAAAAHLPNIFTIPKTHGSVFCRERDLIVPGLPLEGIHEAPSEEQEQTILGVVARIEEMNDAPMAPVSLIPFSLFELPLRNMLRRLTTPEETARNIHENVVEWMNR